MENVLSSRALPPLPQEHRTSSDHTDSGHDDPERVSPVIQSFTQTSISELAEDLNMWKMPRLSLPTVQSAALTPPSPLSFDPEPLPYKGLSLSAAEWTFTSNEFQEIVSRAIRLSSRESYIRLLSLGIMDETLPQEIARLNTLKMVTQAKYKFHVHRRTMLLQALNSISSKPGTPTIPGDSDSDSISNNAEGTAQISAVSKLACQLSETTTTMDLLAADLVTIATHQSQISSLMSTHWGSALAIALRKLNSSYLRRTQELKDSGQRVAMLEAEVAEAWNEADRLASEMDALEKFADAIPFTQAPSKRPDPQADEIEQADQHPDEDLTRKLTLRVENEDITDLYHYAGEAVIETANVVFVPHSLRPLSEPPTPFGTSNKRVPHRDVRSQSVHLPITLRRTPSTDAISSHSTHSVSSRRARVSAAKKRSSRASLASLRIPVHSRIGSRTGSSAGHGRATTPAQEKQLPPLPTMSDAWNAVSKVLPLPKIQRRRSDQDGGPGTSFSSQSASAERDGMRIEIVPRRIQTDPPTLPSSDPPAIPPVWLNSDGLRHSALKPNASANDATFPESVGSSGLSRNHSVSTGDKHRTLIRHGSESILGRIAPPTNPIWQAESEPTSEAEVDVEVPRTVFAPNCAPSALPTSGSRFFESPSIISPGNEPPSAARIQRSSATTRVPPGSHTSRLGRIKTMTRKYQLALHPFGIKKVESH